MRARSWLTPELREILEEGRHDDLRTLVEDLHPNTAAELIGGLENDEIVQVLSVLPVDLERDVFEYFDPEVQTEIVLGSGRQRVKHLLQVLPSDERAQFLDRLDEGVRAQLVPLLAKAQREDLLRREQFEDDQVGSILGTEYTVLAKHLTAGEAIGEIRRQEPSRETIYYIYVVDEHERLIGVVSLRDVITARDAETIDSLMKSDVVSIAATADREEAAQLITEYDLLALPVVDANHRLCGIVTVDDALDILEEEANEDVERMAGVTGETEAEGYMDESVMSQIRRRGPSVWIFAAFYLITAKIIDSQSESLGVTWLQAFLPLVMATGGTVGIQAGSLVIRALTIGGLEPSAVPAVLWKEVRISIGLATVLSAIVFVEGLAIGEGAVSELWWPCVGMAVAMVITVAVTSVFGATIPLAARAIGRDPAMISAPAITALADLSGAAIYLITLQLFLA